MKIAVAGTGNVGLSLDVLLSQQLHIGIINITISEEQMNEVSGNI